MTRHENPEALARSVPRAGHGAAMRIVFLGTAHDNGGSSILAAHLANAMRAKGHHVEEWYLFGSAETDGNPQTRIFHAGARSASPLVLLGIAWRLLTALREAKPDAIFGLQPLSNLLAAVCGRLARVGRRIGTLHLPKDQANPLLMNVERLVGNLGFYTDIVACGGNVADSYRGNGRTYSSRLIAIPNGQPKPKLVPRAEARELLGLPAGTILGQIGRMSDQKNQPFTLDLMTKIPGMTAYFVGSGPTEPAVRAKVAALDLGERVIFRSSIPQPEVGRFFSAVDIILFPSTYEGLSLAAIEAIHARVPLVCSDVPSFREMFSESRFLQDALLAPLDDPQAWIERIGKIANDEAHRRHVGNELERISKRYSFETMANRYLEMLKGRGSQ